MVSSLQVFQPKYCRHVSSYVCYMSRPSHFIWSPYVFGEQSKLWYSSLCSLIQPPATSFLLGPNIFLSPLFSNTLGVSGSDNNIDWLKLCSDEGAVIAQSVYHWATGWTIGVLGFDSRRGLGNFFFTTVSRTALGPTQPPIQWLPGALSLGVKRPGREADNSPQCSAEVKEWVELYLHSPNYAFMVWCLVKHNRGVKRSA
jgi:hypothetical protein